MPAQLHLAGLLQYPKEIAKQIEDHLLKVYAALFVPTLQAEADQSAEKIKALKQKVADMRRLVEEIRENPRQGGRAFMELLNYLMPLMLNGVLREFGVRPDRLEYHMDRGSKSGVDRHLKRVEHLIDTLEKETTKHLGDKAKAMREDIKEWLPYYDEDEAKNLHRRIEAGEAPDLTIKLEPSQFPFLGEKFQRHVEKLRGKDAEMFDDMPEMTVKLRQLPNKGMAGLWNGGDDELVVQIPPFAPFKTVRHTLRRTLQHELRHMTQTAMSKALGIKQYRVDDEGKAFPQYLPSPGMAGRDIQNLDILQMLMWENPKVEEKRREIMRAHKLQSKRSIYSLDDLEFYTHLADRVLDFEEILEVLGEERPDLGPAEKKLVFDIFTGARKVPRAVRRYMEGRAAGEYEEDAKEWIAKHDPKMAVLSLIHAPDTFFRHMLKYKPDRWKKAVKEFAKITGPKVTAPPPETVQKLWQEFLDERYEGGKRKVRNPNPKTRDSHPEITVSYLMKQDAPAYQSGRQRLRREFAGWRARREKGPERKPSEPSQLDLFGRPPSP